IGAEELANRLNLRVSFSGIYHSQYTIEATTSAAVKAIVKPRRWCRILRNTRPRAAVANQSNKCGQREETSTKTTQQNVINRGPTKSVAASQSSFLRPSQIAAKKKKTAPLPYMRRTSFE